MQVLEAAVHAPLHSQPPGAEATMASPRHDCYAGIHKALRLGLCRTLVEVGSADPHDEESVTSAVRAVELLVDMSQAHVLKEDTFMHPMLEQARPGSTQDAVADHHHHAQALAELLLLSRRVRDARGGARPDALARLYTALGMFMAEDIRHMHHEETVHNALLWAHFSDAELLAVEQRIVASIPPDMAMRMMAWFMPALNAPERQHLLGGIRATAPAPVFEAVSGVAAATLAQSEFAKLARALGIAPVPGLVSAARG